MKQLGILPDGDGLFKIASIDMGVDYCGWSKIDIKKCMFDVEILTFSSGICDTTRTKDKSKENLINRFSSISTAISNVIGDCRYYIIEIPSMAIYDFKNRAVLIKRSDDIRNLQSSTFFLLERIANDFTSSRSERSEFYKRFKFIEPSQWQDRTEIKNFKDSKDWSLSKANEFHIVKKEIKIHHESDAICMLLFSLIKEIKERNLKLIINNHNQ